MSLMRRPPGRAASFCREIGAGADSSARSPSDPPPAPFAGRHAQLRTVSEALAALGCSSA